jgi:2-polyprenyl-3-methyl-5-hydroxy-6-metoxy-1,4-benzoquinol methylase
VVHDARYDRFADWYPAWVGDGNGLIADGVGELLPASIQGARVLDVACGHGRASRALASLGADVLGVDISAELVARARSIEDEHPLGVTYRVADIARPDRLTRWSRAQQHAGRGEGRQRGAGADPAPPP